MTLDILSARGACGKRDCDKYTLLFLYWNLRGVRFLNAIQSEHDDRMPQSLDIRRYNPDYVHN